MKLAKSRLFEPGLTCPNCYVLFSRNGKKPACMSNRCGIADVAGDVKLNEQVTAFLHGEMLDISPGYSDVQRKLLRDSGLSDETPETILALKSVLAEYRAYQEKASGNKARKR